jgi:hypothetical protein
VRQTSRGRMRRWAMMVTCLPENFFSNSRIRRCWILWNWFRSRKGTWMMMAWRLPTSTWEAEVMNRSCRSAFMSVCTWRSKMALATCSSKASGLAPPSLKILLLLPANAILHVHTHPAQHHEQTHDKNDNHVTGLLPSLIHDPPHTQPARRRPIRRDARFFSWCHPARAPNAHLSKWYTPVRATAAVRFLHCDSASNQWRRASPDAPVAWQARPAAARYPRCWPSACYQRRASFAPDPHAPTTAWRQALELSVASLLGSASKSPHFWRILALIYHRHTSAPRSPRRCRETARAFLRRTSGLAHEGRTWSHAPLKKTETNQSPSCALKFRFKVSIVHIFKQI